MFRKRDVFTKGVFSDTGDIHLESFMSQVSFPLERKHINTFGHMEVSGSKVHQSLYISIEIWLVVWDWVPEQQTRPWRIVQGNFNGAYSGRDIPV